MSDEECISRMFGYDDCDEALEAKDEMIADLRVAAAHYIEVATNMLSEIEKKDARIAELENEIKKLKENNN